MPKIGEGEQCRLATRLGSTVGCGPNDLSAGAQADYLLTNHPHENLCKTLPLEDRRLPLISLVGANLLKLPVHLQL